MSRGYENSSQQKTGHGLPNHLLASTNPIHPSYTCISVLCVIMSDNNLWEVLALLQLMSFLPFIINTMMLSQSFLQNFKTQGLCFRLKCFGPVWFDRKNHGFQLAISCMIIINNDCGHILVSLNPKWLWWRTSVCWTEKTPAVYDS